MASNNNNNNNNNNKNGNAKVNFDWMRKNNVDLADLVKMARKNKQPGRDGEELEDDSDDSYYEEEIIEDEEVIEDDLSLLKKRSSNFHIPQFHQASASSIRSSLTTAFQKPHAAAAARPAAPVFIPPKIPIQEANKKKKRKSIDGSKLLLLQSAEQKIIDATNHFKAALQEGTAIVSLLEFMLANNPGWDDDELVEVNPEAWETQNTFVQTIDEAKQIVDRLETAKHELMGTRNRTPSANATTTATTHRSPSPGTTTPTPSSSSSSHRSPSPETTATTTSNMTASGRQFRTPSMLLNREPSFRVPDLATLKEEEDFTEKSSTSDEEDTIILVEVVSPPSRRALDSSVQSAPAAAPPVSSSNLSSVKKSTSQEAKQQNKNEELDKAKSEMMKFAKQGAALASKLEKKTESKKLAAFSSKVIDQVVEEEEIIEVVDDEDELATAKQSLLQFAKEGAALASKLEKKTAPPKTTSKETVPTTTTPEQPKGASRKNIAFAEEVVEEEEILEEIEVENNLAKAKQALLQFAQEGAVLASKLEKKKVEPAIPTSSAKYPVTATTEKKEGKAENDDLAKATQEGAVLASNLDNKKQNKTAPAVKLQEDVEEEEIIEEVDDDDLAKAKQSLLQFAQEGAVLAAKLEKKKDVGKKGKEREKSKSESVEAAVDPKVHAKKEIEDAKQAFLEAAKQGTSLVATLESRIQKQKQSNAVEATSKPLEHMSIGNSLGENKSSAEPVNETDVSNAKMSFVALAQQGADLVAKLEKKLQSTSNKSKGSEEQDKAKRTEANEDLAKAGNSFLQSAKDGAKLMARLETQLEESISNFDRHEGPSSDASKLLESSGIAKLSMSMMEAAEEGAEIVTRLLSIEGILTIKEEEANNKETEIDASTSEEPQPPAEADERETPMSENSSPSTVSPGPEKKSDVVQQSKEADERENPTIEATSIQVHKKTESYPQSANQETEQTQPKEQISERSVGDATLAAVPELPKGDSEQGGASTSEMLEATEVSQEPNAALTGGESEGKELNMTPLAKNDSPDEKTVPPESDGPSDKHVEMQEIDDDEASREESVINSLEEQEVSKEAVEDASTELPTEDSVEEPQHGESAESDEINKALESTSTHPESRTDETKEESTETLSGESQHDTDGAELQSSELPLKEPLPKENVEALEKQDSSSMPEEVQGEKNEEADHDSKVTSTDEAAKDSQQHTAESIELSTEQFVNEDQQDPDKEENTDNGEERSISSKPEEEQEEAAVQVKAYKEESTEAPANGPKQDERAEAPETKKEQQDPSSPPEEGQDEEPVTTDESKEQPTETSTNDTQQDEMQSSPPETDKEQQDSSSLPDKEQKDKHVTGDAPEYVPPQLDIGQMTPDKVDAPANDVTDTTEMHLLDKEAEPNDNVSQEDEATTTKTDSTEETETEPQSDAVPTDAVMEVVSENPESASQQEQIPQTSDSNNNDKTAEDAAEEVPVVNGGTTPQKDGGGGETEKSQEDESKRPSVRVSTAEILALRANATDSVSDDDSFSSGDENEDDTVKAGKNAIAPAEEAPSENKTEAVNDLEESQVCNDQKEPEENKAALVESDKPETFPETNDPHQSDVSPDDDDKVSDPNLLTSTPDDTNNTVLPVTESQPAAGTQKASTTNGEEVTQEGSGSVPEAGKDDEINSDDESQTREDFLHAANAEFLIFQKDLEKKLTLAVSREDDGTNNDDDGKENETNNDEQEDPREIKRTGSVTMDC